MAVTIVRTNWIDDDGSGTTGTVLNNAVKTALYNDIDGALAKVAQLTGGNSFTGAQTFNGNQTINGALALNGNQTLTVNGTGLATLGIANYIAGATNGSQLMLGNDQNGGLTTVSSFSSTWTAASYNLPSSTVFVAGGTNGLMIMATAAGFRFGAGGAERMRIMPTGDVLISCVTNPSLGKLGIVADLSLNQCLVVQNSNKASAGMFIYFLNSSGANCGGIRHTGAATTIAYDTTSDARLKDDSGRAADLSSLRGVVVHDFTWKADGVRDRGIFAQEAHALYPRAVSPGTDDTTDDGTLKHPWMTDYSKFVPDLIVGWQQHDTELAALRAELATLKGLN